MRPSINPFRANAIARQRYKISSQAMNILLHHTRNKNYRGCIRGPHGTGKSTLLEDVAGALKVTGKTVHWYYLNQQTPRKKRFATLKSILRSDSTHINCIDGGETIGYLVWVFFLLLVTIKNKSVLATTHIVSPLNTVFKTEVNEHTMLAITQTLAGSVWSENLKQLAVQEYTLHKGNCREVFRACYWYCCDLNSDSAGG